jgi:hypothetical protein
VRLHSLGRTAVQRAARHAWNGSMRVLGRVRQPKRQRGPKGQRLRLQIAPARPQSECAQQRARKAT